MKDRAGTGVVPSILVVGSNGWGVQQVNVLLFCCLLSRNYELASETSTTTRKLMESVFLLGSNESFLLAS